MLAFDLKIISRITFQKRHDMTSDRAPPLAVPPARLTSMITG
jgi:hypothetical protein